MRAHVKSHYSMRKGHFNFLQRQRRRMIDIIIHMGLCQNTDLGMY